MENVNPTMDHEKLVATLSKQELVNGNLEISKKLAGIAQIEWYEPNQVVYEQGDPATGYFFMALSGQVQLKKDDRLLNQINEGEAFGETPMVLNTDAFYVSATAMEQCTIAKIPNQHFLEMAEQYPEIWKNIAKMYAKRLRNAVS
jgi:CRP-like cAMP-binding protein